jgi:uncharacterized protein (TIGR02284 family)
MAQLNTPQVHHAADIIQVLNSGIEFYSDAKEQVRDQRLVQLFDRMLNARRMVKERLQPFAVLEDGKREEGSAFSVEVRKVYTKVIGAISSDTDHAYISQLEEVEDKTLEEVEKYVLFCLDQQTRMAEDMKTRKTYERMIQD